jgi:hypothetical protein
MRIQSSRLSELRKQRQQYIDIHENAVKEYNGQVESYQQARTDLFTNVENEVRAALTPEIDKFPGIKLEVSEGYENQVCVNLVYRSPKSEDSYRSYVSWDGPRGSGHAKGISFNLVIYLTYKYDKDDVIVDKRPSLDVNFLDSDDYDMLVDLRDLFKKVDKISWKRVLGKANRRYPKREEYVTRENPGELNTKAFDQSMTEAEIEQTLGKDLWIKVIYTGPSTRADHMWGEHWIRLVKVARAFYYVNAIEGWDVRNGKLPLGIDEDDWRAERAIRDAKKERKIRKDGLTVCQPLEVMSTDELIMLPEENPNPAE